ncbi:MULTISPECIES: cupin domain-containing protein [Pseudomonas]|uniref:cupin domain-containing protein n=1 Tax=Pseudomonas TaxID=286 RepID=UPI0018E6B029|nr:MULTISPECIES: cupin domain-containing protein [Pseudomonas]MBI6917501.1 cupin domain-containing protein [Pseudomonas monteilii]MCE0936503.1 cupin domain-containing protein [Pseudomonas kurunegalensis]
MTLMNTPDASVQTLYFEDDGATPNSRFPVLLYRLKLDPSGDNASAFEVMFAAHQWTPLWRSGIFDYHHFHPNAHEALGIACGRARLTLGGEYGQSVSVERGDVLVLPAGTGHRCIECSDNFLVVGAYPLGQEDYDIQRPDRAAHPRNLARIAQVLCPEQDPVCGIRGMLLTQWR